MFYSGSLVVGGHFAGVLDEADISPGFQARRPFAWFAEFLRTLPSAPRRAGSLAVSHCEPNARTFHGLTRHGLKTNNSGRNPRR